MTTPAPKAIVVGRRKEAIVRVRLIPGTGDFVIIVNADKIAVSPSKLGEFRYRHSGYPGGLSKRTVGELLESRPERLVELAVKGMLPKNTLGRKQLKKLKVYAGPEHPHAAQNPQQFEIKQVAQ